MARILALQTDCVKRFYPAFILIFGLLPGRLVKKLPGSLKKS
jgi:hypothetical protein